MNDPAVPSAGPPVLVIGRSGQVAQALGALSGPDMRFVCVGREDGVDVTKPATLAAAIAAYRPDIVVNAAAYTAVDKAESEPAAAFAANRDGPGVLAALCAAENLPLIHISTDYVFDGTKPAPYVEDDPIAPLGVYGASKAEGEAAVRAAGGPHLILRVAWVYSPGGQNFVRTMLRLAETRDELGVVTDQIGSPTAAGDIAAAIRTICLRIRRDGRLTGGQTFHLTGSGTTHWHDFAAAIFAASGTAGRKVPRLRAIATADYPTPAKRPANSRLDCARIAAAYGIVMPDWRDSLAGVMKILIAEEKRPA